MTVVWLIGMGIGALVVPHPVPWTHICAMPPGVAHTRAHSHRVSVGR